MTIESRRQWIRRTAGLAVPLASAALAPRSSGQTPDNRLEVLIDEPLGRIAPEIYGHFVEHLGGVVYDGIWVGENSRIANVGGLRKQLVDALKQVRPAVIRWPGGCFADQYDWHDGVGARKERPARTNFWVDSREWPEGAQKDGPQVYDPNEFGTIEFVRFCRQTGAEPYFAANLRSLPAQDFWRWVEYVNAPAATATAARRRAADGETAPLNVRYWGVGNESWGCGGNFAPGEYAVEFRRYTAWVPSYGVKLAFVGSGPNSGELEWTRDFFANAGGRGISKLWGWALHHYSWNVTAGRLTDWYQAKGDALRFGPDEYYELLREAARVEDLIQSHWQVMGEYDRQHQVKLVVDEWGAWYQPGTAPFPEALLGQQNTMRDAVLAGVSLNIFNRHAGKVAMANIAQLVNCLQSLFLAHEDRFCVTPTYHVFRMYTPHQGAESVRVLESAPSIEYNRNGSPGRVAGLSSSASLSGKQLTVTVANIDLAQARETEIVVRGAKVVSGKGEILQADDVHAHNSFATPAAVSPRPAVISPSGGRLVHRVPPASVMRFDLQLA